MKAREMATRDNEVYFDCDCSDFNHVFRFSVSPYDGIMYLYVRLNHYDPWYKRILNALKYVFKRDVAYGHYDVTLLRLEDYDRLRELLNKSQKLLEDPTLNPHCRKK